MIQQPMQSYNSGYGYQSSGLSTGLAVGGGVLGGLLLADLMF
jgi:hypothetical protein